LIRIGINVCYKEASGTAFSIYDNALELTLVFPPVDMNDMIVIDVVSG